MTQPLLHPSTKKPYEQLLRDLPQSLLVTGDRGVGLRTTALHLAGKQLSGLLQPRDMKGDVNEENGTISVSAIRELYTETRTKSHSRRIIVIDNADRMSPSAQGAFLKLLEEPNPATHFVLTSHLPDRFLPTIRSRVQQFHIQPLTHQQTEAYITSLGIADNTKRAQLLFIAEGLPAEIFRLQANEEYFAKRASVMADARDILKASNYQTILLLQKHQSDKSTALQLIDSMLLIALRTTIQHPQTSLIKQLGLLLDIRDKIGQNFHIRLQLARLVL